MDALKATAFVDWPIDSGSVRIPIIDVTQPAFKLEETIAFLTSLEADYIAEEERQRRTLRWIRSLFIKLGARQSRLLRSLVYPSGGFLDGLTTYLMKLGPANLPPGFDSKTDQRVVSTPHVTFMRLRLQQCAFLLAEGLTAHLEKSAHAPLHLFNIAGGTAVDSLNALILIKKLNPELLQRTIKIFVFDIDEIGPSFGAKAAEILQTAGKPLAGIDLHFIHELYNWNDSEPLHAKIQQSANEGAIIAASSEGALFEYGHDAVILSNLRAMNQSGSGAKLIVGSVTAGDELRRASVKRAAFNLIPRSIEDFNRLVESAGVTVHTVKKTPLSYQVLLLNQPSPGESTQQ